MANLSCECRSDCAGLSIVASVIIGIITAILQYTAVITLTPAFLWVLLGIGVVYLAIVLFGSFVSNTGSECSCSNISVLLWGLLGTILFSVVLLGVTFGAASIIGAILSGVLLAFFSLAITSTACLIKCLSGCGD